MVLASVAKRVWLPVVILTALFVTYLYTIDVVYEQVLILFAVSVEERDQATPNAYADTMGSLAGVGCSDVDH